MGLAGFFENYGYDNTVRSLPSPPDEEAVSRFKKIVEKLLKANNIGEESNAHKRFDSLLDLLFKDLGYKAAYILIDGVDAFYETANSVVAAVETIRWFLENESAFAKNNIFIKYFLPIELADVLKNQYSGLTSVQNFTIIRWEADTLREVIRQRILDASNSQFDSLRAISDLNLRGAKKSPEQRIAEVVIENGNGNPRQVVLLANRLFTHHASMSAGEPLSKESFEKVIADFMDENRG